MKENSKAYDICLIFPPLIGVEFCPPAGIPSLVAYLKAHGYNPCVLDMDSIFQKSFFTQKMLLLLHELIFSSYNYLISQKNNFNTSSANFKGGKKILIQLKIAIGSFLYITHMCITIVRIFLFRLEKRKIIHSLENILEIAENMGINQRIESRLRTTLERSIKNTKKLGISVIYPQQILYGFIIAKLVKKINKEIFIILGGPQITMHIQKFLNNKSLLNYVDGFVVHEGEISLCEILNDTAFDLIPNFYYKSENGYKPSRNVDFVMPVEQYMTPDFDEFNINIKTCAALPIRTLRGCYWGQCRFCSYPFVSHKFAMTNAKFVVESIMKLKEKYNMDRFELIDSSLPANFLAHIAKEIIENNLKIRWNCMVNCEDAFRNCELVALLKQSGCTRLTFGLESANERIMQYMNKLQRDRKIVLEITKTLSLQGIIPAAFVMFGFPTETKEEMEETLDFVMMLKTKYQAEITFSVFNLLEHSYIYNNQTEFKINKILKENDTSFQGYGYKFICPEGASRREAYYLWNKAVVFNTFPFLYSIRNIFLNYGKAAGFNYST